MLTVCKETDITIASTTELRLQRFDAVEGGLTSFIRNLYMTSMSIDFSDANAVSVTASTDPDEPIYFWQLYSVMGEKRMRDLIHRFYELVLKDNTDFGRAFVELGDLEHHVSRQLSFWMDVTGGGKTYKGGLKRLEMKHRLSRELMHESGSRRWMYHFVRALRRSDLGYEPVRVLTCVVDFLCFFMHRYSVEFDFNFVDSMVYRSFRARL